MINRDQLRLEKQRQCEERLEIIYKKFPDLQEVDQIIAQKNIAMIRAGVLNKDVAAEQALQQEIQLLMEQHTKRLQQHGLDESIYKPQWDCPLCEDKGYIRPGELCSCYQKERMEDLFLRSGMPQAMRNFTFDNFDIHYYEDASDMEDKLRWCRQFAWQVQQGHCEQSLFLTGDVGRGKTHLAAAIANTVLENGNTVIFRRAADLFELIRQYRYEEDRKKFNELLEQLRLCDLLVIDDLGREKSTDFVVEQLMALIEDRNYQDKPWIITSNLNMNEITDYYTARTAERILDRAKIFSINRGESIRFERAMERKKDM